MRSCCVNNDSVEMFLNVLRRVRVQPARPHHLRSHVSVVSAGRAFYLNRPPDRSGRRWADKGQRWPRVTAVTQTTTSCQCESLTQEIPPSLTEARASKTTESLCYIQIREIKQAKLSFLQPRLNMTKQENYTLSVRKVKILC